MLSFAACGAGCNVDHFDSTVYSIFFLFLVYVLNVTRADNPEAVYPSPLRDDDFWVHITVNIIWILESFCFVMWYSSNLGVNTAVSN